MRLPSRVRALILLAQVLDLPGLRGLVRALTREPRVEVVELEGVQVEIVRPGGRGPWPAWLFVNGAHPERRREPVVERLSRGLARAGYAVFVPDVPGLGDGVITKRTLDATCAVTRAAADHDDVRGGRVAVIGASTGAAIALLTAAREELAERISIVAAVAPFADLTRMVGLATTRSYAENGSFVAFDVTPLHRRVVARSLVAALADEGDRTRLLRALDGAPDDADPIAHLPRDARSEEARAVIALLANDDPHRFEAMFGALPEPLLETLAELSPLAGSSRVRAPVEIVVPPSDAYFPLSEAKSLADALPNVHLTVTATLDHTRPRLSLAQLRSFVRFDRFVMRGLRAAAG